MIINEAQMTPYQEANQALKKNFIVLFMLKFTSPQFY